jgi:hypothetical protein
VLAGLVIVGLILPGTLNGAAPIKADWRGTAQEIVNIVRSDPDSSYIIVEPSFRPPPLLNYYLARYSRNVRVKGVILRADENRGGPFTVDRIAGMIAPYDFMIVPFLHHTIRNFPRTLETLKERYPVHFSNIDRRGRGVMVFTVSR